MPQRTNLVRAVNLVAVWNVAQRWSGNNSEADGLPLLGKVSGKVVKGGVPERIKCEPSPVSHQADNGRQDTTCRLTACVEAKQARHEESVQEAHAVHVGSQGVCAYERW